MEVGKASKEMRLHLVVLETAPSAGNGRKMASRRIKLLQTELIEDFLVSWVAVIVDVVH